MHLRVDRFVDSERQRPMGSGIKDFGPLMMLYPVMSSGSEILQDTLRLKKFEFWHEILGVDSDGFNLLFQTTGVLIINEIFDFDPP